MNQGRISQQRFSLWVDFQSDRSRFRIVFAWQTAKSFAGTATSAPAPALFKLFGCDVNANVTDIMSKMLPKVFECFTVGEPVVDNRIQRENR